MNTVLLTTGGEKPTMADYLLLALDAVAPLAGGLETPAQQARFRNLIDDKSLRALTNTAHSLVTPKVLSPLINEICLRVVKTPQDEPFRALLLESCAFPLLAEQLSLLTTPSTVRLLL